MTDNEIIKALKCCVKSQACAFDEDKFFCHHGYSRFCDIALLRDALSLINRQKAEIETSQKAIKVLEIMNDNQKAEIERLNSRKEVVVPSMRLIDGNPLNGFNLESHRFVARTVEDVKAEAYQEFWQEAKQKGMHPEDIPDEFAIPRSFFDKVYERLVGELNG